MIIDYIHLSNFLSHSDSVIRFERGINIIYGKNGAGKSSIVDAIRFALFGEKRGDKIAELVRSGNRECAVTIGFRLNDRYYEVYRSMTLGNSGVRERKSWIKLEGEMIAETSEGVTGEIQQGLRIPKDTFLNSVFVRQGEMDALISETARKREELFSKIIGIDVLSEDAMKLKTIRERLRLQEARFSTLGERIERNREQISETGEQVKESRRKLSSVLAESDRASKDLEEADRVRTSMLERKARYDGLIRRASEIGERKEKVDRELSENSGRLKSISFPGDRKEEIEKNPLFVMRELVERFFRTRDEARMIGISLEAVESSLEDYERESRKLDALRPEHDRFVKVEEKIGPLERKVRDLEDTRLVSRSLSEEIEKERLRTRELASSVASREFDDIRGLSRKEVADLVTGAEDDLREIDGERRTLRERISNMQKLLTELRKNKDTLGDNRKCPVCGTILDQNHLDEIHRGYGDREKDALDEINITERRIAELSESYRKNEERKGRLRRPEVERFISSMEEIERLRMSQAEKREKLSQLQDSLDELDTLGNEYQRLIAERDELQPKEKEFNAVVYSMGRVPVKELRDKLASLQDQRKSGSEAMENLSREMGFTPADGDREKSEELAKEYERIRSAESEYSRISSEIENLGKQKEELEREARDKESEIREMGDVATQLQEAVENYGRIQQVAGELRQQGAAMTERLKTHESNLERLRKESASMEEEGIRLKRIGEASSKLEKIRGAFDRNGIQALIRKDSSVSINNMTRNYLSSFNFDFDDVRIDENFDIRVINNGVEEALDSLSGGERISLAIAVRLAIARYLTGRVSTVIMDEPTNFLDEDRRNNLKDIIKYSLKDENMVQQMIMITHHSELTSAADLSLEVTKSGGVSSVVQG